MSGRPSPSKSAQAIPIPASFMPVSLTAHPDAAATFSYSFRSGRSVLWTRAREELLGGHVVGHINFRAQVFVEIGDDHCQALSVRIVEPQIFCRFDECAVSLVDVDDIGNRRVRSRSAVPGF